ncbi:MAG: hypothetical protein AAF567_12855 [Actinomycetota bacterium]
MPPPPPATSAAAGAAPVAPAPQKPWYRRGRYIAAAVVGVIVLLAAIGSIGTTRAGNLSVGDCFEIPDGTSISSVTDQDCSGPHEAEVFAEVEGSRFQAEGLCFEAFLALTSFDAVPVDAELALLSDENEHKCLIESPSGALVGSISAGG